MIGLGDLEFWTWTLNPCFEGTHADLSEQNEGSFYWIYIYKYNMHIIFNQHQGFEQSKQMKVTSGNQQRCHFNLTEKLTWIVTNLTKKGWTATVQRGGFDQQTCSLSVTSTYEMTSPNWDIPVGKQMAGTLDTEYLLMILGLEGDKFSIL